MKNAHLPDGQPVHPLLLLTAEPEVNHLAPLADLAADERIHDTYWIDLPGHADAHAPRSVRTHLVTDVASIDDLTTTVMAIHHHVTNVNPGPALLVIDGIDLAWRTGKDTARARARATDSTRAKLGDDPNAIIAVDPGYWDDAHSDQRLLIRYLVTFPGIVTVTGVGSDTLITDVNGAYHSTVYRHNVYPDLVSAATLWVQMPSLGPARLAGGRIPHLDTRPGRVLGNDNVPVDLSALIYDTVRYDYDRAVPRRGPKLAPSTTPSLSHAAHQITLEIDRASIVDDLHTVRDKIGEAISGGTLRPGNAANLINAYRAAYLGILVAEITHTIATGDADQAYLDDAWKRVTDARNATHIDAAAVETLRYIIRHHQNIITATE